MHPFSVKTFCGPGAALEVSHNLMMFSWAYYLYAYTLSQTVNSDLGVWERHVLCILKLIKWVMNSSWFDRALIDMPLLVSRMDILWILVKSLLLQNTSLFVIFYNETAEWQYLTNVIQADYYDILEYRSYKTSV